MKATSKSTIHTIIIMIIVVALIAGCYLLILQKKKSDREQAADVALTEVEELAAMDLVNEYPLTPRAVLKLYCRINECFYNEELTTDQLETVVKQMRLLFDEEFLGINPYDTQVLSLMSEIEEYKTLNKSITGYQVESAGNVVEWEAEGESYARLIASFTTKQETVFNKVYQEFLFRKDDGGLWKIVGWRVVDKTDIESE